VVSERGSIIYFVIADMAGIDPMYQYSLSYFIKLFNNIIKVAEKNEDVNVRIETLMKEITFTIFSNICRGLFNSHKLIFSFMLAAKIQLESHSETSITRPEWDLFLKGVLVDAENIKSTKRPTGSEAKDEIFDEKSWRFLLNLECTHNAFDGLPKHILDNAQDWIDWVKDKEIQQLPGEWSFKLTQFQ
jgi:dynein heavy chain